MAHLLVVNRAAVIEKFSKDDRSILEDVRRLREWLETQPHLPAIDDVRLEKVLVNCKFSLEATKKTVDAYFTMRSFLREFFGDMDPLSPTLQSTLRIACVFPLKLPTKDNERVIISKVWDHDAEKFHVRDYLRCSVMIEELRTRHDYEFANHFIFDFDNFKFGHLIQVTPDIMLKSVQLYLKGYKLRFTAIHIVNPPPFIDVFLKIFKMALSAKIYERVVVHKTFESLHERIPKEILPSDLGGDLPPSQELHAGWIKELEENREWFLAEQKILVDESKRPQKLQDEYFGSIHGTFKTLQVD